MHRKWQKTLAVVVCGMVLVPWVLFAAETRMPVSASPVSAKSADKADLDANDLPGVTSVESISNSSWLQAVQTEKSHLAMVAGRSQVLKFSKKIKRLSVSNPEVLDFAIMTPSEVLINAKAEGVVNIIAWDYQDAVSIFDVSVTKDPELLLKLLKRLDPKGRFEIYPSKEVFVVKGEASDVRLIKQIEQAANAFAEGSVSLVEIKKAKQILLKTRFLELTNQQNYQFGLDFQYIYKRYQIQSRMGSTGVTASGDTTYTPLPSKGGSGTWANIWDTIPATDGPIMDYNYHDKVQFINPFLKAMEEQGVVKTIARPNLLAKDGEEASFLVGGEAAVVTVTSQAVAVTYKEYGTKLKFKPEIVAGDRIRLTVEPEVSALDFANGVVVSDITVPSFTTTRAKTVVELKSGEVFVIGGLIQQKLTTTDKGFPGLRRVPLIGKLFESLDHQWEERELLVVVEPVIIEPDSVPLTEEADKEDNLSYATRLQKSPIAGIDDRLQSIEQYLLENKRFVSSQMGEMDPKDPVSTEIDVSNLSDNLDKLEAQLGWKQPAKPAPK